ncbi:MAG: Ppx/GppA family phosphatase [Sphingomonadales bacterium]|nr:Ppx/GppA family phosphatase [Sphingomonadales bacterium]MBD3772046.1 Ppx/GppA family phosphatase [Paracoccaceae bacterium]
MADFLPPDENKRAGKQGGHRSGKVADFRYRRSPQSDKRNPGSQRGTPRDERKQGHPGPQAKKSDPRRPDSGRPDANRFEGTRTHNGGEQPPRRQAYAALDLGTNNCRLLIARPAGEDFTVIDAFSRVVRLGEGLANSGALSQEAMDRALGALKVCADKLRRRNVHLARSVATEACRRAANGTEFIERVRRETGILLDIISAEEEARLAVLGCHILLESGEGPAMIFDIGGGSTELVLIEPGGPVPRILDWQSVPYGVVSLTDTVGRTEGDEESRKARFAEMHRIVSDSFAPFAERVESFSRERDIRLLGTSGTVTTLASLHLELPQYDRRAVDGLIVPAGAMRDITGRLAIMSPKERSDLPCIGSDRADLVVAGCAILEAILDIWPADRLGVADRGIREGILRSLIAADVAGERSRAAISRERRK